MKVSDIRCAVIDGLAAGALIPPLVASDAVAARRPFHRGQARLTPPTPPARGCRVRNRSAGRFVSGGQSGEVLCRTDRLLDLTLGGLGQITVLVRALARCIEVYENSRTRR